jgi:hypothetical protein
MTGVIVVIPNIENTATLKNFTPSTCLPTAYKTIIFIISKRTQKYVDDTDQMPNDQKGCCIGLKLCKDRLLISKAILQECKCMKKNVCMAWIDYQETFDFVPHRWIIKSLE